MASANEISLDAAVAAVSSELDTSKEEQRTILKTVLQG